MALSCIVSEKKQDIGRKITIYHSPFYDRPTAGVNNSGCAHHRINCRIRTLFAECLLH